MCLLLAVFWAHFIPDFLIFHMELLQAGHVAAAALSSALAAAVVLTSAATALPAWADEEQVELPAAAKAIAESFSGYTGEAPLSTHNASVRPPFCVAE